MPPNPALPPRTRITIFCLCGDTAVIWTANPQVSRYRFWGEHQGDGHGPCTSREATAIRRERAKQREVEATDG